MLDNIADLLLMVSLMSLAFEFPTRFAIRYMVPGTAIGVLIGDLLFFVLALRLARRTGRNDITAMPLGLDTPSTFGMVFFVLGPAFLAAKSTLAVPEGADLADPAMLKAATYAWHIGICSIVTSGVFKFACAFGSNWIRRMVPRAGLLGSLTAIALVLISFLPLMEVLRFPIVGFMALAVILTTLVAKIRFPGRIPGALAAVIVAGLIYYLMKQTGTLGSAAMQMEIKPEEALLPYEWFAVFRFEWVGVFQDSLNYLPIVLPFALATVIGGIDCTESAAAAGDEFDTGQVIGVEAVATLAAGLCGGVIQSTPYIGHPAYKAMGGRAAYTLATALFVGGAGVIGYFGFLYALIPKAAVFPILVFIGLEITAQSFRATPKRHYAAIALACLPAMAALVMIYVNNVFTELAPSGVTANDCSEPFQRDLVTVRAFGAGFIITSLLWASALAAIIDRRLIRAAAYFGVAGLCALYGIIHSPLPKAPVILPRMMPDHLVDVPHHLIEFMVELPLRFAGAYWAVAVMLVLWACWNARFGGDLPKEVEDDDPC